MNSNRDLDILRYLLEQISVIENYVGNYDDELFLRDSKTKDAVLTRLVALGEYAARINDIVKNRFDEVDWKSIKAARNYYIHVYRGVDWILVWNVITDEIPGLKVKLENIIEILERE
jgi:uncharacterized protein with HEPN domain